jgi:beta-glucosidase
MTCCFLSAFVLLSMLAAKVSADDAPASTKPTLRTDDFGKKRFAELNDRVKSGNDAELLMIGDSITQGWEGKGKKVWAEFYGKRKALNLGVSGDKTQDVLGRLENGNIEGLSPKLAVLMIGTNNIGRKADGDKSDDVVAGVKAIVEKLREKLPEMKILVIGIFPRGEQESDPPREVIKKANEVLANLADGEKVFYLDIGDKFLAADRTLPKDVMPDFLHLSAKGYRIWAEAIEPTVAKLLDEKKD